MKLLVLVLSVLTLLVGTHARCRCLTHTIRNYAKPTSPCIDPITVKTQESTYPPSPKNVNFTFTYIVDDIVTLYIGGKPVSSDEVYYKRRYTINYSGPCDPIIIKLINKSPNNSTRKGGAGVSLLVNYKGVTYGSFPHIGYSPCGDSRCMEQSSKDVVPIVGYGLEGPVDSCFTDPQTCVLKDWKPLVVDDRLLDRPLCEFVDIARKGGWPLNPSDALLENGITYGIKFDLPFCR